MEIVEYHGWQNNVRLHNEQIELIVTQDVGPRIARLGFIGGQNVFGEIADQQGNCLEDEWMIRGGHRFWVAPEKKPDTYELDNSPIDIEDIPNGIRTIQAPGPLTGIQKTMEIVLGAGANDVTILHTLTNTGAIPIEAAPWALSVMAQAGTAIIPLPARIPHTDRLTHNQEWSLWGYTDLSDPRWRIEPRYIFFRHDATLGPNKLGMSHREGWVAYHLGTDLFIKRFDRIEDACYPDAGMNFETFANEDFLELESLGQLITLGPGESTSHLETWSLRANIPTCKTGADVDANIIPVV